MPNTAKITPPTQAEIDQATKELYEALIPPTDIKDCKPWEDLVKEVNARYGFDEDETVWNR